MQGRAVEINHALKIPISEFQFRFARSGGPGGQKVNRTATRVELFWDVAHSPSLDEGQRARIRGRLAGYMNAEGVLRLVCSETASQLRNREMAVARLVALVQGSLHQAPRRVPSKPSRGARERRLSDKRVRSQAKRRRRSVDRDDW